MGEYLMGGAYKGWYGMDDHIDSTKPHRGVPSLTWWVGEGTARLNAPTPTVGLHHIDTPSITTQYTQGT